MTIYKCTEIFDDVIEEFIRTGVMPTFTIQTSNDDQASSVGRSTKIYNDCVLDGDVLGKPGSQAQAREMLRRLSGRVHQVYTGVSVCQGDFTVTQAEATQVRFRPLTEEEIHCYVRSGEPMDKAGAYGAQGKAALFVSRIEGDYFNVMGLPLYLLGNMLEDFGVHPFSLEEDL